MMELFYFRKDIDKFQNLFYEKILHELLGNNFLCKFYESELFLYFMKFHHFSSSATVISQSKQDLSTQQHQQHHHYQQDFLSYYLKRIIILPSHFSVHQTNYSLESSDEKADRDYQDALFFPILAIFRYSHDQGNQKYICEKSMFAKVDDPSKHHPDLQEIKKLSSRYFLSDLGRVSSFRGGSLRNFRLEGKPSISVSTQRAPLNQLYCCQLIIPFIPRNEPNEFELTESSASTSINEEDSLDFIDSIDSRLEFLQVKEVISLQAESLSTSTTQAVKSSVLESIISLSSTASSTTTPSVPATRHKRSFSQNIQQSAKDLLNNGMKMPIDIFHTPSSSKSMMPFTSISKSQDSSDSDFPVAYPPTPINSSSTSSSRAHRHSHTNRTITENESHFYREGIAITLITRFPLFESIRHQLLEHYSPFLGELLAETGIIKDNEKLQEKVLAHSAEFLSNIKRNDLPDQSLDALFAEFHFELIEEMLTFPMIVILFFGMLMEFKIAFILDEASIFESWNDSLVLIILEWMKCCLSPLTWEYPALSFLPLPVIEELIECPTPYFIGMSLASFRSLQASGKIAFCSSSNGSQVHNVSHLLVFHLTTKEIIIPSIEITSSTDRDYQELSFLNHLLDLTDYHRQHHSINQSRGFPSVSSLFSSSRFPLLEKMKLILFPGLTRLTEGSHIVPSHQYSILSTSSTHESQDALQFPKELFSLYSSFPSSDSCLPEKSFQLTVLLRSFVEQLLSHWDYCSLPILNPRNCRIIDKVLFDEKMFLLLKLQQIAALSSASVNNLAENSQFLPFLLSLPNFTIFMESFLRTQSFSSFLSFHSSQLMSQ